MIYLVGCVSIINVIHVNLKLEYRISHWCYTFNPILTGLLNTHQNQGGVFYPLLIRFFFTLEA